MNELTEKRSSRVSIVQVRYHFRIILVWTVIKGESEYALILASCIDLR